MWDSGEDGRNFTASLPPFTPNIPENSESWLGTRDANMPRVWDSGEDERNLTANLPHAERDARVVEELSLERLAVHIQSVITHLLLIPAQSRNSILFCMDEEIRNIFFQNMEPEDMDTVLGDMTREEGDAMLWSMVLGADRRRVALQNREREVLDNQINRQPPQVAVLIPGDWVCHDTPEANSSLKDGCTICSDEDAFKDHGACKCPNCSNSFCQECYKNIVQNSHVLEYYGRNLPLCPFCRTSFPMPAAANK